MGNINWREQYADCLKQRDEAILERDAAVEAAGLLQMRVLREAKLFQELKNAARAVCYPRRKDGKLTDQFAALSTLRGFVPQDDDSVEGALRRKSNEDRRGNANVQPNGVPAQGARVVPEADVSVSVRGSE